MSDRADTAGVVPDAASASGTPPATTPPGAPRRPPLASSNGAPVMVKLTPPFTVRMSQFLWIISFGLGGFAVVYFFVIRQTQLPLVADAVRAVSEGRSDETYDTAADIVYWIVFGGLVAVLLVQITLLVSFMGRRPYIRWWQLGTVTFQAMLVLLSGELVAIGERGEPLRWILYAQCGLTVFALFWSVMPGAMAWTARRHDIRRKEVVVSSAEL